MADMRHCSKPFLLEFIELYRQHDCLWKIKSKEYSDRDKKNQAYALLVNKLQEVDQSADKDMVQRKINSLRTTYRKEYKKVLCSMKSGTGEEDIYKPLLWYYKYLHFLNDQEIPRPSISNMDNFDMPNITEEDDLIESEMSLPATPSTSGIGSPLLSPSPRPSSFSVSQHSQKRKKSDDSLTQLLQKKLTEKNIPEDKYMKFSQYISEKLRSIDKKEQQLFAEKLINDVLFEAELGTLSRFSKITNPANQINVLSNQEVQGTSYAETATYFTNFSE